MKRIAFSASAAIVVAMLWHANAPSARAQAQGQPAAAPAGRGDGPQGRGRGGRGGGRGPRQRKVVLAWADTRNGIAQHESVSHALSVIERLGYESGASLITVPGALPQGWPS